MRQNAKVLLTLFILLACIMMLIPGCSSIGLQEYPTPTPVPTSVTPMNPTYTVQRGEVVSQMQFTARIAPTIEYELFFGTEGRVRNVFVKRDDSVVSGQPLADLEVLDDLERRLQLNQLAIRRAQANIEIAKLSLEMIEAQPWTSYKEYEIAIKELEIELAQIALEEVSLTTEDLEEAVADAQIVSPIDGILLSIALSEGGVVNAYETVAIVADLSDLEVSVELDRHQLERLAEGMSVVVALISQPGVEIGGDIRQLPYPYGGGSKEVEGGDNLVHVALDVSDDETSFEIGDLVRVTVVLERREDVLWIPPQAVRTFEGRRFVVTQEGDIQRRADVGLGIQGDDRVEVLEGLDEGQIVVGP